MNLGVGHDGKVVIKEVVMIAYLPTPYTYVGTLAAWQVKGRFTLEFIFGGAFL